VAELADAHDLGSCVFGRKGSSPFFPNSTTLPVHTASAFSSRFSVSNTPSSQPVTERLEANPRQAKYSLLLLQGYSLSLPFESDPAARDGYQRLEFHCAALVPCGCQLLSPTWVPTVVTHTNYEGDASLR